MIEAKIKPNDKKQKVMTERTEKTERHLITKDNDDVLEKLDAEVKEILQMDTARN